MRPILAHLSEANRGCYSDIQPSTYRSYSRFSTRETLRKCHGRQVFSTASYNGIHSVQILLKREQVVLISHARVSEPYFNMKGVLLGSARENFRLGPVLL